ncbi:MAG: hypothetical protein IKV46_07395 [Bacteroidales bacterium]|jgi:hypothetical protein|nr:hypothetical protein [Bacteroidales bacterium]
MKKLLVLILMSMLSAGVYAQKEVTKFLGIPVDGTRTSMIQKLRAKGFTINREKDDMLDGKFNGEDVNIAILTQHDKVWRVLVADVAIRNEVQVKMRFNELVRQFENNGNYYEPSSDQSIPDKEDIKQGMNSLNKQYQAYFIQKGTVSDDKRLVWIEIMPNGNGYNIVMFYENGYNRADGSDL